MDEWDGWEYVHPAIVKVLGKSPLVQVYCGLIDRIARIRNQCKCRFTNSRFGDIRVEHTAILDALTEGDGNRAETAAQLHLQKARFLITELNHE